MDEKRTYKTARIDESMIKIIDRIIEDKRTGYKTRSEFIHDSLRKRIEDLLNLFPDLKTKIKNS